MFMNEPYVPDRLDQHLKRLYEARYHLGRKIERAEKLIDRMKDTRDMSITDCRIYSSNSRASWFKPGRPLASTDPVYRRIEEARLIVEQDESIANILGVKEPVKHECIRLHKLIENRQMTEEQYLQIEETPAIRLAEELTQAIDADMLTER